MKNKALLCKPFVQTKATSCRPVTQTAGTQTGEYGETLAACEINFANKRTSVVSVEKVCCYCRNAIDNMIAYEKKKNSMIV